MKGVPGTANFIDARTQWLDTVALQALEAEAVEQVPKRGEGLGCGCGCGCGLASKDEGRKGPGGYTVRGSRVTVCVEVRVRVRVQVRV